MIGFCKSVGVFAVITLFLFSGRSAPAATPTFEWTRQFGTSAFDHANGVSTDALGNVFVAGQGNLTGVSGSGIGYIRLYDTSGNEQWTRQVPFSYGEVDSVSADGLGNAYVVGVSAATPNPPTPGGAYVAKYNSLGDLQWSTLFDDSQGDLPTGVSADSLGSVYVSGSTINDLGDGAPLGVIDAFVRKYDSDGNTQWTRQLGSYIFDPELGLGGVDIAFGVSTRTDGLGNVFIAGRTDADLDMPNIGSSDGFVAKYDADGNFQWVRQFGTTFFDNGGQSVAADAVGNAYAAGYDGGSDLPGGNGDKAVLRKYDPDGNLIWFQSLETGEDDRLSGVAVDGLGGVFVSGFTAGDLDGTNSGSIDAFVSKFDVDGNLLWTKQFGTGESDSSSGLSVDGLGNVYATGSTNGSLFGPNAGQTDAFLVKLVEQVPEPASWSLLVCGMTLLRGRTALRWRKRTHT